MSPYNPQDELSRIKNDIFSEFKKIDSLLETKNHKPLAWKFESDYSINGQDSELEKDFFGFVRTKLSAIMHNHRMQKYSQSSKKPFSYRIIAEGDSWFEHPLNDDIIDNLIDLGYAVCCYSEAGDTLLNMAEESEFLTAAQYELPKCFLLSGGGNDILHKDTLNKIIDLSYQKYININELNTKIQQMENALIGIISKIQLVNPGLKVFMHGYDYIFPREHKYMWVYPVLLSKNITDLNIQRNIIIFLIDRFNELLKKIQSMYPNIFYHIDLRGTLKNESDWSDEIHPSETSFKLITNIILEKIHSILPKKIV